MEKKKVSEERRGLKEGDMVAVGSGSPFRGDPLGWPEGGKL